MKKILVLSLLSFTTGTHHINSSRTFIVLDSSVFELPFTAYEQPSLIMQCQDDTFYILNYYGSQFYVLDKNGSINKRIELNKVFAPRYKYFPVNFYLSKHYYVFNDGNLHPLFLNKSFKVGGYFFCRIFSDHYWGSYMISDFFYSEKNNKVYLPCYYGKQDTDTIQSLTHDFYTKNIVASYKIPYLKSADPLVTRRDTNFLKWVYNPQYLIHHDSIYSGERGFLPYLDFAAISLDDAENEVTVGEAADSLLKVYDLNGNLLRTFGRNGVHIEAKDSLRFIRNFDKKTLPDLAFGFIMDSIRYRCAYYGAIKQNPELKLLARSYLVPDSSTIVSGKDAGYSAIRIWNLSTIKETWCLQVYDHENLVGDFAIPKHWSFIGFRGKSLVFFKIFHIENSDRYTLHIYYVSPQI